MISTGEKVKFVILRTVGNFLVLFSIFGMAATFGPVLMEEGKYRYVQWKGVRYVVADVEEVSREEKVPKVSNGEITPSLVQQEFFGQIPGANIQVLRPVDPNFSVVIPKIGANSRVIPNVDAGNYDAYINALTAGVAHADGTGFPGGGTNIYLFAHSTDSFWNVGRYNAVFYLLKELERGDEVDVFYGRVRYTYKVVEKKVVPPSDVQYLIDRTPYEQLILQTCWPPGTTLERLLVIARPENALVMKN